METVDELANLTAQDVADGFGCGPIVFRELAGFLAQRGLGFKSEDQSGQESPEKHPFLDDGEDYDEPTTSAPAIRVRQEIAKPAVVERIPESKPTPAKVEGDWYDWSEFNQRLMETDAQIAVSHCLRVAQQLCARSFLADLRQTVRKHYPRFKMSSFHRLIESKNGNGLLVARPTSGGRTVRRTMWLMDVIETMMSDNSNGRA